MRDFVFEILSALDLSPANSSVLEMGASSGQLALYYADYGFDRVVASECRESGCRALTSILSHCCRESYRESVSVQNDRTSLDDPDFVALHGKESYDVVCSFRTLSHLRDPIQHIMNMRDLARRYVVIYTRTYVDGQRPDRWSLSKDYHDDLTSSIAHTTAVPHYQNLVHNHKKLGFESCRMLYPSCYRQIFPYFADFGKWSRFKVELDYILSRRLRGWNEKRSRIMRATGLNPNYFAYILEK